MGKAMLIAVIASGCAPLALPNEFVTGCTDGQKQCSESIVYECAEQSWEPVESCPQGCPYLTEDGGTEICAGESP